MTPRSGDPFVSLEGVTLTYGGAGTREDGGTLALAGASLSIRRSEFAALVGPSGCGKSTLLKLVAGLVRSDSGRIAVGGDEVRGPLKIVGMAFQNPTLLPWRTTRDNVLLPVEIVEPHRSRRRREKQKYVAAADGLLATVGLEGFSDRHPWQLSGGMQQRAQLCRALIHEPDLLLLDEPFGALDAFTREELWAILQTLYLERQCTAILVTHDLREAVFLADTVHIMSARPGRIIASHDVGFARPRTLEDTFRAEFVDLVHELRHEISTARMAA
jgi:NitT/TauT family transport system ATP-binding protein